MLNIECIHSQLPIEKRPDISKHVSSLEGLKPAGVDKSQAEKVQAELSHYRLLLLQALLEYYPQMLNKEEKNIPKYVSNGSSAIDSIYAADHEAWGKSWDTANNEKPEFKDAIKTLDYFKDEVFSQQVRLLSTISHGTSFVLGTMEVIPQVFYDDYGTPITEQQMKKMVPQSCSRLLRTLTQMPGSYALDIEQRLTKYTKDINIQNFPMCRDVLDANQFTFTIDEGKNYLDIKKEHIDAILISPNLREQARYHGCLATSATVKSEQNVPVMAFLYIQKRLVKLLEEYWYPIRFKKKA